MKQTLFILLTLIVAFIYGDFLIDRVYQRTYIGCRPLFPHPFWSYGNILLSTTIAIVLLKIFKIEYTILELFIVINIYLVLKALVEWYSVYSCNLLIVFELILSQYLDQKTLLFATNYLTLGFLWINEKE